MILSGQNRTWLLIIIVLLGLVVVFFIGRLFFGKGSTTENKIVHQVEDNNDITISPPPKPTYPNDAPLLKKVREALKKGISPKEALEMAKTLPDGEERADAAFLLLEYAADAGVPEAAFLVAKYYDPTDDTDSGSIIKNPSTSYFWYMEALSGGQSNALEQLKKLKIWVQKAASNGSQDAIELLKEWQ